MRFQRFSSRYGQVVASVGSGLGGESWAVWRRVTLAPPQWRPPADLYENVDALVVKVEIAGMAEEEFEVRLYDDTLVVEGERACESCTGDTRYHAAELRYGPFRLEVPIPVPVDRERATASYERGFLKLTLPLRDASAR